MNFKKILSMTAVSFCLAYPVFAETQTAQPAASTQKPQTEAKDAKSGKQTNTQTFQIALKDYHVRYGEDAQDYESGWMNGLRLAYKNQNPDTKQYWRIQYERTKHDDQYIGALQDMSGNITPYNSTTKNNIVNKEFIFANPLPDSKNTYGYVGIGFHNWDRRVLGTSTLDDSIEQYSWKYIPIGYRHEYKINDKWDGAVDFAFRITFDGKMKAPASNGFSSMDFKLGNDPGFKLELPFTYKMNSQWSLSLTPWYEYWHINQSNWVPAIYNGAPVFDSNGNQLGFVEPNSKTFQFGIDIGINYQF